MGTYIRKELDLECTHHTIDKDNREWEPIVYKILHHTTK